MFSGFSSYLGFNPRGSQSVQTILQKPDYTLDELLDDEELLTELKTLNSDLLSFLKAEENYTKMINHVIKDPSAEEQQLNPQRCFKFPLVSTDVLSSDCTPLVLHLLNCNRIDDDSASEASEESDVSNESAQESEKEEKSANENIADPKYMDLIFTLLDQQELNFTAAGYFAKIMTNLLEKHSSEFFTYIFKTRPQQLEKLVNHISSESIAELLVRILIFETNAIEDPADETYTTKRIDILRLLAQRLDEQKHPELASGAAYIITEVVPETSFIHKGKEVVSCLLESAVIRELYTILKTKNVTSVASVTQVLGKLLEHALKQEKEGNKEESGKKACGFGAFQQQEEPKLSSELPIVAITLENIQCVVSMIAEALEGEAPFGNFRMRLVDLMGHILDSNNSDMHAKVVENEFFKVAMKLFAKFEWHNILHNRLEKIIISVLTSEHENLKVSLFENGQVLETIIKAFKQAEVTTRRPEKKIRRGYLGQLINIANKIVDSEDEVIKKYTENNQAWEEYTIVELNAENKKTDIQLGGINPKFERYGSFEIKHWPGIGGMQNKDKDSDDQQNDQEGCVEEGFKLKLGGDDIEESEQTSKPTASKFSQLGAVDKLARRRSKDQSAIEEEILGTVEKLIRRRASKDQGAIEEDILGTAEKLMRRRSSKDHSAVDEEIPEAFTFKLGPIGNADKLMRRRSSRDQSALQEDILGTVEKLMRRRSAIEDDIMGVGEKLSRRKGSKDHDEDNQFGAGEKLIRRHTTDDEIKEEVLISPQIQPGAIKFFKFEDVIDECIEEDIQEQASGDDSGTGKKGGLKIQGLF